MHSKALARLAIVVLACLLALPVAYAEQPTPPGKGDKPTPAAVGARRHGYFGTVQTASDDSFLLATKADDDLLVLVTDKTRFHIPGLKSATLADLEPGDRAAVSGTPSPSGFTAKNVAVAPGKPIIQHHVGIVSAYIEGSSVTIKDKRAAEFTFTLTADTVVKGQGETGEIAVGSRVTVVARRIPSEGSYTATAIVVHPSSET